MAINYRPRRPEDEPFLIKVSMQTMNRIFEDSTGSPLTEAMVLELIDGNQTTIVIESDKQPIGFYSYSILPSGQLYLSAIVLAPTEQNKGLGGEVIKRVERVARTKGIDTILGHIHYANSQSLVFTLKNGFRILGPHMKGSLALEKRLSRSTKR